MRCVTSQIIPHIFACDKGVNSLIKRLEHDSPLTIEWFLNNNNITFTGNPSDLLLRIDLLIDNNFKQESRVA